MLVVSPLQSQPLAIGDIPTHVFRSAEPYRDEVVLVDAHTNLKFTIGDIITTSTKLAAGLARSGFGGRVISVYDDTQLRCVYVYYAALMIGGTYQSLGTDISAASLTERISHTESPVVFTTRAYLEKLQQAIGGMNVYIYLLDDLCKSGAAVGCCMSFAHLLVDDPAFAPVRITTKDDAMRKPAYLAYSPISQQHETPHQLMLSHYGLLSSQRLSRPPLAESVLRTAVSVVPFANTHGISNIAHFPMLSGSRVVQLSSIDPVSCLAAMEEWKAGVFLATYSALSEILKRVERKNGHVAIEGREFDIGPLQVVFMHELRMSDSFKDRVSELLGARIVELYGYMETGLIAGMITEYPRIDNSVGVLCPNVSARVVLNGREVDEGQFGEILISTPRLTLVNSVFMEGSNYFRTGDYGRVTSEGVVIIKARMSDLIYTQSGIIIPADVEASLLKHPAVAECAVVALRRKGMDDIPFVFIVTKDKDKDNAGDASAASAADAEKDKDSWYNRRQIVDDIISSLTSLHPGIHGSIIDTIPKSSRGGPDRAYLRLKLASDHC